MKRFIAAIIPHISIIASGMIIVFFVIDRINPYMGFMSHKYTQYVTMTLAVSALIGSIMLIVLQRREVRRRNRRIECEERR